MDYINNFAFFWVGEDITIPSYLVKSINKTYKNNASIFMLTNKKTPYIDGVTKTIRSALPKQIMLARLKAYSQIKLDDQILFLDADSLVLNKFKKLLTDEDQVFFRRDPEKIIINYNYPEYYPEFVGKTFNEMMPFLFGAMITKSIDSHKIFELILKYAKQLPPRFHRWYGDQYALKLVSDAGLIKFTEEKFTDYVKIIKNELDLKRIDKSIITFKGLKSKKLIYKFFTESFE